MNEKVWHDIFKKYIDCYEAILTLQDNNIFDEEETLVHKADLLRDIILAFKSEV